MEKGHKIMKKTKNCEKVRFFPYFPYGICSRLATTIEGKQNPYATSLLTHENADAVRAESEAYRRNILDRARYLCDSGFVRDKKIPCGSPAEKRSFRTLTRLGMTTVIDSPDMVIPADEDEDAPTRGNNGNKKGNHFRSHSKSSTELRTMLYEYAASPYEADRQEYANLLLESVQCGKLTPLSNGLDIISDVKLTTSKYSQNQTYNIWRLSHINAMFLANDFLTYLSRRPHDTGFAIDGIIDYESYQEYVQQYGCTVAAYTYRALSEWYRDNPGYYQITQKHPDTSEEARQAWLTTPAFYYAKELPISENDATQYATEEDIAGSQQRYLATHIGLAVGKKVNYVCYHGKPGAVRWQPVREEKAKAELERAVHYMKTQNPDIQYKDTVDFGMYFCSSYHQFLAMFQKTKDNHNAGKRISFSTDNPYTSLHIIPVNDSGTFLLWCLLEYTPMETEETIRNSLMAQSEDFHFQSSSIYPLTYKGKRVFLGYTMNVAKINRVLEDHLDGQDFYICCFPEQISWYQNLLPGHTIL